MDSAQSTVRRACLLCTVHCKLFPVDKKEAKRLGAWISLMGGAFFILGALAAIYVAFMMKPETAARILSQLGRLFHRI